MFLSVFSDGFQWLIDFFRSIYEIIQHFFESLANGLNIIREIYLYCSSAINVFPNWLRYFAFICIGVCITYFIIGRSHD